MDKKYFAPILLINCHICGLIGLLSPYKFLFQLITPFNLLLGTIVLLYFQEEFSKKFWGFISMVFAIGFVVEVIGSETGVIFGQYSYGDTLGIKLFNVPLVMGLNWLTLIYSTGVVLNRTRMSSIAKSGLGAGMLVFLDCFIEPVAMKFDFWQWQDGIIPIQNFMAWYVISFLLLMLFYLSKIVANNRIAMIYIAVQFFIFCSLKMLD